VVDITRPSLAALVTASLTMAAALTLLLAWHLTAGSERDGSATPAESSGTTSAAPGTFPTASAADPAAPYAFWGTDRHGAPLRWDACAPVPFILNLEQAPPGAERDLRRALAELRAASGLDLVLAGLTDERPRIDRPLVEQDDLGWRWRPVLVAWAEPGEGGIPLGASDRGIALPIAVRDGDREAFITGMVVLNAARSDLEPGFADRSSSIGATILHEVAHILGLAHVVDPTQILAVDPGRGPVVLGAGDRAGLRLVGAEAGCNAAPPPAAGRSLTGLQALRDGRTGH